MRRRGWRGGGSEFAGAKQQDAVAGAEVAIEQHRWSQLVEADGAFDQPRTFVGHQGFKQIEES